MIAGLMRKQTNPKHQTQLRSMTFVTDRRIDFFPSQMKQDNTHIHRARWQYNGLSTYLSLVSTPNSKQFYSWQYSDDDVWLYSFVAD